VHGVTEVLCFKQDPVIGEGGELAMEAGRTEAVVKEGLYDRVGFRDGNYGMRPDVVFCVEIIEDELVVVVEGELEVVAGGTFDGDGRAGEADGEVLSLLRPGEVFDEVLGFGVCPWFALGEFTGFVVF